MLRWSNHPKGQDLGFLGARRPRNDPTPLASVVAPLGRGRRHSVGAQRRGISSGHASSVGAKDFSPLRGVLRVWTRLPPCCDGATTPKPRALDSSGTNPPCHSVAARRRGISSGHASSVGAKNLSPLRGVLRVWARLPPCCDGATTPKPRALDSSARGARGMTKRRAGAADHPKGQGPGFLARLRMTQHPPSPSWRP